MTWGSILVLAVIAVIVLAVIVKMIKDKKAANLPAAEIARPAGALAAPAEI